jgi:hypothetical protein
MFFWFLTGRWIDSGIAMFQQREATLPIFADWVFSIWVTVSGLLEIGLESGELNSIVMGSATDSALWDVLHELEDCDPDCGSHSRRSRQMANRLRYFSATMPSRQSFGATSRLQCAGIKLR